MLRTTLVLVALAVSVLVGMVGRVAAEICFSGVTNQQFHLEVTATTTTSVGSVMSLVGINHFSGDPDLRSPVTGTLYVETDPAHFRVSLLDMNGLGLGPSLLWNARLAGVSTEAGIVFSGPFTVDAEPAGGTLTGTLTLVDCATSEPIVF